MISIANTQAVISRGINTHPILSQVCSEFALESRSNLFNLESFYLSKRDDLNLGKYRYSAVRGRCYSPPPVVPVSGRRTVNKLYSPSTLSTPISPPLPPIIP